MKTESLRTCECARASRVGRPPSEYRTVLVRAMAHAAPSAPPRRSASIADRHQAQALS
jgi:hypothetical protein